MLPLGFFNPLHILLGVMLVLLFVFRRELMEAMKNFRGGPPTPMHPSPANDGALLRRRSRKVDP